MEKTLHSYANRNQKTVICAFLLADTPCLQMAAAPAGGNLFHPRSLSASQKSMPNCENHPRRLPERWSVGSGANAHLEGDEELTLTNHPTSSVCFLVVIIQNTQVREPHLTGWLMLTITVNPKAQNRKAATIYCSGSDLCLSWWMGMGRKLCLPLVSEWGVSSPAPSGLPYFHVISLPFRPDWATAFHS